MDILIPGISVVEKLAGVASFADVRYAILEEDGHVSVIRRQPA